jgi:hypothetical protein
MLPNDRMTPLFEAAIQAVEEAIINVLVAAQTLTGINGNTVYALPHDRLVEIMRRYGRLSAVSYPLSAVGRPLKPGGG